METALAESDRRCLNEEEDGTRQVEGQTGVFSGFGLKC